MKEPQRATEIDAGHQRLCPVTLGVHEALAHQQLVHPVWCTYCQFAGAGVSFLLKGAVLMAAPRRIGLIEAGPAPYSVSRCGLGRSSGPLAGVHIGSSSKTPQLEAPTRFPFPPNSVFFSEIGAARGVP